MLLPSCFVHQLKIAYRVYTRNGDKEDAKGRYRGWPADFDEWIPVNSMNKYRFGKLNTRVTDPVDEPVDDISDPPFVQASNPPPRFSEPAAAVIVRAIGMCCLCGGRVVTRRGMV